MDYGSRRGFLDRVGGLGSIRLRTVREQLTSAPISTSRLQRLLPLLRNFSRTQGLEENGGSSRSKEYEIATLGLDVLDVVGWRIVPANEISKEQG